MSPEIDKRLEEIRALIKRKEKGEAHLTGAGEGELRYFMEVREDEDTIDKGLESEENMTLTTPSPGELWLIRLDQSDPEMVLVIDLIRVEESHGAGSFFTVAPLFTETEWIGPEDFLFPTRVTGFKCAAALGLSVTISDSLLDKRIATLPSDWSDRVKQLDKALEAGDNFVPSLSAGLPYLDEKDSRMDFHETLARRMEPFQEHALGLLFTSSEIEDEGKDENVIYFPALSDKVQMNQSELADSGFGLAAAGFSEGEEKTSEASYQVEETSSIIRLRIERDGKHVNANVFDLEGNPDQSIDGAVFRDAHKNEIGRIENSQSRLPAAPLEDGFSIEESEGQRINLKRLDGPGH